MPDAWVDRPGTGNRLGRAAPRRPKQAASAAGWPCTSSSSGAAFTPSLSSCALGQPRHHPLYEGARIFARPAWARTSLIPSSHGATWRRSTGRCKGVAPQRPASRPASAPKRFRFTTKIIESSLQPRPQPLRATCNPTASSDTQYVAPPRASQHLNALHSSPTSPPAPNHARNPHPRAILTVIPIVLHIRICDARLPSWRREGWAGWRCRSRR